MTSEADKYILPKVGEGLIWGLGGYCLSDRSYHYQPAAG